MATPEPDRETTIDDVMHVTRLIHEELKSLRRVMLDEFGSQRHWMQALDRDMQGLARQVAELGDAS